MIKIGVTGSLSSGKTTVVELMAQKKFPIFSADKEVRKIYKSARFISQLKKKFNIKKKAKIKDQVKKLIKKDKKKIKDLEKLIHPYVRKNMIKFLKKNERKKAVICEIPLLIESKLMKYFDHVVFVYSYKKVRLKRYLSKGGSNFYFTLLNSRQIKAKKKIKLCNYVINNFSSLRELKKNVKLVKSLII